MPEKPTKYRCPNVAIILAYYESDNERLLNPLFKAVTTNLRSYSRVVGINCPQTALDVTQISLVQILVKLRERKYIIEDGTDPGPGRFWKWAYQLHELNARNWRRGKKTLPSAPNSVHGEDDDPLNAIAELPDMVQDPESELHKQQALEMIVAATKAVLTLNDRQRKAIFLLYYQGLMVKEASALVGMHESNFAKYAANVLQSVRHTLLKLGFTPSVDIYKAIASVDTEGLFEEKDKPLTKYQEEHLAALGRVSKLRQSISKI